MGIKQISYSTFEGGKFFSMDWEKFLQTAAEAGFRVAYKNEFVGSGSKNKGSCLEEEVILFDEEYGFIIYSDSLDAKHVQTALLFGEFSYDGKGIDKTRNVILHKFSNLYIGKGVLRFTLHLHGGFEKDLQIIKQNFTLNKIWVKKEAPLFLNYMEKKNEHDRFFEISERKFLQCLPEARKIILG